MSGAPFKGNAGWKVQLDVDLRIGMQHYQRQVEFTQRTECSINKIVSQVVRDFLIKQYGETQVQAWIEEAKAFGSAPKVKSKLSNASLAQRALDRYTDICAVNGGVLPVGEVYENLLRAEGQEYENLLKELADLQPEGTEFAKRPLINEPT